MNQPICEKCYNIFCICDDVEKTRLTIEENTRLVNEAVKLEQLEHQKLVANLNDSHSEMMIEIAERIEALVKAREKCIAAKYKPEVRIEAVAEENEERATLRDLGVPIEDREY